MTKNFVQKAWTPVVLGSKKGNKITSYVQSSSWYNTILSNDGSRRQRLLRYHEADTSSIEISRALDIICEDITACNADNQEIFKIDFPDDSKVKKTTINVLNDALKMWEKRTGLDHCFFDRVRKTLKYGITFYLKNPDGSLTELPTERMVGYILSEEDENIVTHYLYDETVQRIDQAGKQFFKNQQGHTDLQGKNYRPISVEDMVIFKVGDTPFGRSLIESVYGIWRQLSMLESAVVIYRVVRAPERRVYYIDTGNLQGPKREAAIERQRLRLMQKQANRKGDLATEYDPHSTSEDIFIPTNSSGKGSRIETLPAGASLGELGDLEWFADKMAMGLRIPSSMIDGRREAQSQHQFSDMRVGQMYAVEMRYLGHVKRLKLPFQRILKENFVEFCLNRGVACPEDMQFCIADSMSFAKYKELEINQQQLNVFSSTISFPSISKKFALQKYLGWGADEIRHNEVEKLKQLGVSEDQIKSMPQDVVDHLVYSEKPNPKIASKYGIEVPEPGF